MTKREHAEKVCVMCGDTYRPSPSQSYASAAEQKCCSSSCGGKYRRKLWGERARRGDVDLCDCPSCKAGHKASAVRQASLPPRKRYSPEQWAARMEAKRRQHQAESVVTWG